MVPQEAVMMVILHILKSSTTLSPEIAITSGRYSGWKMVSFICYRCTCEVWSITLEGGGIRRWYFGGDGGGSRFYKWCLK